MASNRLVSFDHSVLQFPEEFTDTLSVDVQMTNNQNFNVSFKFLVSDTSLCHIIPARGVLPPNGQQRVNVSMHSAAALNPGMKKVVVHCIGDVPSSMNEKQFKELYMNRKSDIEKHGLNVKFGDGATPAPPLHPSGTTSVLQSAVQTPYPTERGPVPCSGEPAIPSLDSRLDLNPEGNGEEVPPVAGKERDDIVKELKKEIETLCKRCTDLQGEIETLKNERSTLQARNAVLTNKAEVSQKKANSDNDVDRDIYFSWIKLYSAIAILLAVIIYSFTRSCPDPKKEI